MNAMVDPAPGVVIEARYRLARRVGEGTFGEVWAAEDLRLSRRPVAVKFLKAEFVAHRETVTRFEAEAEALARVHHPNVVAVLDRGAWGERRFIVTEFVVGVSLAAWIDSYRQTGSLPPRATVFGIFDGILAGMEAAHAIRVPGPIVHRDLKPDNVLVREDADGSLWVKILDFGIAQLGGRRGTRSGALMGTPRYMAPEQAVGNAAAIGPASDVFALGVILVEMLTLRAQPDETSPWWGVVMGQDSAPRARISDLGIDVSGEVAAIIATMLRARPGDRLADAGACRRALRATLRMEVDPVEHARASSPERIGSQIDASPRIASTVVAPPPPRFAPTVLHVPRAPRIPPVAELRTRLLAFSPSVRRGVAVAGVTLAVMILARLFVGRAERDPTPATTVVTTAVPAGVEDAGVEDPGGPALRANGVVLERDSFPVGRRAAIRGSLTMVRHGDRVAIGWVVAGVGPGVRDTVAAVEVNATGAPSTVIMAEAPDTRPRPYTRVIERATPHLTDTGASVHSDGQWSHAGGATLSCGGIRDELVTMIDRVASPNLAAMVFCRTVAATDPFVLGVRSDLNTARDRRRSMSIVALREGSPRMAPVVWSLPVDPERVLRAPDPISYLQSAVAPDREATIEVPGQGYAVALRFDTRLYMGWLGPDLRPVGELHRIEASGIGPGQPRMAWNGREVVLVYADHDGGRDPYRLYAVRVAFGYAPGRPSPLQFTGEEGGSNFAPDIGAFGSGDWLITWTREERDVTMGSQGQQDVMVNRYDPELRPRAAVQTAGEGASDSRAVVWGSRFVVAMMAGRRSTRDVLVASGECGASTPAAAPLGRVHTSTF